MFFKHKKLSLRTESSQKSNKKPSYHNRCLTTINNQSKQQSQIDFRSLHNPQMGQMFFNDLSQINTSHNFSNSRRKPSFFKNHTTKLQSNHFQIHSKMSTEPNKNILAYGLSTYKGDTNVTNPHHLAIHLGIFKHFMLIESYDGLLASRYLKNRYPIVLLELTSRKKINPDPHQISGCLIQAFKLTQAQLIKEQINKKNNSGAFLNSVIIEQDKIIAANCGPGHIVFESKGKTPAELSTPHTLSNEQQLKRIKQNGVKVYQEKIMTPFEEEKYIEGPLKIFPSGLNYTRILGRAFDYKKQKYLMCEGILSTPSIIQLQIENMIWVSILSESVKKACTEKQISQLIKGQFPKKSKSYTEHHIAMECSFKMVNITCQKYPERAASAVIILLRPPVFKKKDDQVIQYLKGPRTSQRKVSKMFNKKQQPIQRPYSLRYIGNRRSFIKKHNALQDEKKKSNTVLKRKLFA